MGMDVYGSNPSSPAGVYFRANIWAWYPIHALMIELCSDLLGRDTLHDRMNGLESGLASFPHPWGVGPETDLRV
jgi:hypothetical protein